MHMHMHMHLLYGGVWALCAMLRVVAIAAAATTAAAPAATTARVNATSPSFCQKQQHQLPPAHVNRRARRNGAGGAQSRDRLRNISNLPNRDLFKQTSKARRQNSNSRQHFHERIASLPGFKAEALKTARGTRTSNLNSEILQARGLVEVAIISEKIDRIMNHIGINEENLEASGMSRNVVRKIIARRLSPG